MIETFTQDVRYALRGMKANPAFTLVAVLSMALGIGANTAIFSLLDAVMLKYLPVQHPEELLRLNVGKSFGVSNPMWEALRDRQDIFSGVFAWSQARFNLAAGGESKFINSVQVSGDFFRTLGVGAGQMSRVDASRIAIWKAEEAGLSLKGSAVASDAFFPFPDGLIAAADAGATCAIQPGGSVRDNEVIAAANERNMAMIFTGIRHFRH